jgi:ACR3 family arsenite efflux pump ArsB
MIVVIAIGVWDIVDGVLLYVCISFVVGVCMRQILFPILVDIHA